MATTKLAPQAKYPARVCKLGPPLDPDVEPPEPGTSETYTDAGELAQPEPEDHFEGSDVRLVCALFSDVPPPEAVSRKIIVPPVPSSPIQYLVPAVILTGGSATVFHAPAVSELSAACARSAPGWPLLLE